MLTAAGMLSIMPKIRLRRFVIAAVRAVLAAEIAVMMTFAIADGVTTVARKPAKSMRGAAAASIRRKGGEKPYEKINLVNWVYLQISLRRNKALFRQRLGF